MGDGSGSCWKLPFPLLFDDYEGNSSCGAPLKTSTVAFDVIRRLKLLEYKVFINHCWPEVKLAHHLYLEILKHGILAFETSPKQHMFPSSLNPYAAIEDSLVHVAIFSKGYAESKDSLDELCEMLKSKRRIIPVFYDVKSSDLQRIEDGPYKEAFINHQKRGWTEKIPIWKEALRKVVDYKGFGMDEVNG